METELPEEYGLEEPPPRKKRKKAKGARAPKSSFFDSLTEIALAVPAEGEEEVQCNFTLRNGLVASLDQLLDDQQKELESDAAHNYDKHEILSRFQLLQRDSLCSGKNDSGPARWERVQANLRKFDSSPSLDQQRFIFAMFAVCLPHIFGKDFEAHRTRLLRSLGKKSFPWLTTIMCPRRWGKTMSVAMMAASLMDACRNLSIIIVSTGQKISTVLMKKIVEHYVQLPGTSERILVSNEKVFKTKLAEDSCTKIAALQQNRCNSIRACPSNVHGFKGMEADLILVDEAARVDPELLQEGVAPLLVVKNTVMVMISTNMGYENYYSQFFTNLPSGLEEQVIRFHVDLLCADCKKNKLNPKLCNHNDHLYPPWLSQANRKRAQLLMSDDKYKQEVLGTIADASTHELSPAWVDSLVDPLLKEYASLRSAENTLKEVRTSMRDSSSIARASGNTERAGTEDAIVVSAYKTKTKAAERALELKRASIGASGRPLFYTDLDVFTVIDPAGGAHGSDYAAVSVARLQQTKEFCVLGLISIGKEFQHDFWPRLSAYFRKLFDLCAKSPSIRHYIGIERNYGGDPMAAGLFEKLESLGMPFTQIDDTFGKEDPHEAKLPQPRKRYGFFTTRQIKVGGMQQLREILGGGLLSLAQGCILEGREYPEEILKEFSSQLRRLRCKDGTYTGKMPGLKDDMVICLLLALFFVKAEV